MIFARVVRYLAREVGRGRRSSYVVRSKVDFLDGRRLASRASRQGKARPVGMARKGHVEACTFPASEEQGLVSVHSYYITLPATGGGQEQEEQEQEQQLRQRQPPAFG